MLTGIVKDLRYTEHNMGAGHPESPQRILALSRMLENNFEFPLHVIEPRPATREEIERVHISSYFDEIRKTAGKEKTYLDPDTSTSARSFETALLAAGGLIRAADLILEGKIRNAFALIRPPGHHAEPDRAMGFCLFNNVAVAAEHLIRNRGLRRVLIVDWDLHHGNGTQNAFYSRNDVLYFSTHQVPLYPGTGYWDETGHGPGEGYTVNVPLYAGKSDEDYLFIFQNILKPISLQFQPEFILVSAGFDIYAGDPLGGMRVTGGGFGALTSELLSLAVESAGGRIGFALEGGYDLEGLQEGVRQVLLHLGGFKVRSKIQARISKETGLELEKVYQSISRYWRIQAWQPS